jgi:hypothetical protein
VSSGTGSSSTGSDSIDVGESLSPVAVPITVCGTGSVTGDAGSTSTSRPRRRFKILHEEGRGVSRLSGPSPVQSDRMLHRTGNRLHRRLKWAASKGDVDTVGLRSETRSSHVIWF